LWDGWKQEVVLAGAIKPDLFDGVAKKAATALAGVRNSNKPSQLRRFYDEIVMWTEKVGDDQQRLNENLPFIRMMNAKTAYAKGRNALVSGEFVDLIQHGLSQVKSPENLRIFKLFIEAVMGFYKELRPKD
jgi:CRISPR-associated protein Csm2